MPKRPREELNTNELDGLTKKMKKIEILCKRKRNDEQQERRTKKIKISDIKKTLKNNEDVSKDYLRYLLRKMVEMNLRLRARNKELEKKNNISCVSNVSTDVAMKIKEPVSLKQLEVI